MNIFTESIIFTFVIVCLATARNKFLFYLGNGILFILASDFLIKSEVITNNLIPGNIAETTWILGLILIVYSLFIIKDQLGNDDPWCCELNSIQPQIAIWCFVLCISFLTIFLIIYTLCFRNNLHIDIESFKNIPSIFITLSIINITISKLFSDNLVAPIKNLEKLITCFMRNENKNVDKVQKSQNGLMEFVRLEQFLEKAFLLLQEKHLADKKSSEIAAQVAHDIRSPLTALDVVIKHIDTIPEEQRILIRNAISRIHDIANNLLNHNRNSQTLNKINDEEKNPELVIDLVLNTISEKRAQYKENSIDFIINIEDEAYGCFVNLTASSFKRILSNIINNSVEAMQNNNKQILISINSVNDQLKITIQDNGCGIPTKVLQKIERNEIISSKNQGNGLGVFYSKNMIEKTWGGKLALASKMNEGTTIEIILPKTPVPNWFASEITIFQNSTIIILDDDESIHQVWINRFKNFDSFVSLVHLYSAKELLQWKQKNTLQNLIFLIDYELLGSSCTGLDLIKQLHINESSYLITSHFDENELRQQSQQSGIRLVPKSLAPHLPIKVASKNYNHTDLIFIDDDKLLTSAWALKANSVGKTIAVFNSVEDFRIGMVNFNKNIPIYIDSDLGNNLKGQDFAKELFTYGFSNLYLATGYRKSDFPEMSWIKNIIGKEPPF